jgi:hypothetical protein
VEGKKKDGCIEKGNIALSSLVDSGADLALSNVKLALVFHLAN